MNKNEKIGLISLFRERFVSSRRWRMEINERL